MGLRCSQITPCLLSDFSETVEGRTTTADVSVHGLQWCSRKCRKVLLQRKNLGHQNGKGNGYMDIFWGSKSRAVYPNQCLLGFSSLSSIRRPWTCLCLAPAISPCGESEGTQEAPSAGLRAACLPAYLCTCVHCCWPGVECKGERVRNQAPHHLGLS